MASYQVKLKSRIYNPELLHAEMVAAGIRGFNGVHTSGNQIWVTILNETPLTPELEQQILDVADNHDHKKLTGKQKQKISIATRLNSKKSTPRDKLSALLESREGDPLADALLEYLKAEE